MGTLRYFLFLIFLAALGTSGCGPEVAPKATVGVTPAPAPTMGQKPEREMMPAPVQMILTPTVTAGGVVREPPAASTAASTIVVPELPTEAPTPSVEVSVSAVAERDLSPKVSGRDVASLVEGNTVFALDLYRQLALSDGDLLYSPYSVSLALAMAYAGAGGETERQMADTLRFGLPQDRLHTAFNALDLELVPRSTEGDDAGLELNIANSVWGQEAHPFLSAYVKTLAVNYGGEVRRADFLMQKEEAREQINKWVSEETHGRIDDLLSRGAITPLTRLVLANAVYFKAEWRSPFDERATFPRPFYALDGGEELVSMMRQTTRFRYAQGDGYQAVDLPYADGDVSMTVLLPDVGRFNDFEDSLNPVLMDRVLQDLEARRVRLTMPKFELNAAFDLSEVLAEMGMPNAFDEKRAEFQMMNGFSCLAEDDDCLLISEMAHKAVVSVDETGTEAAAAATGVVAITEAVPEEPIEVTIDRPFIFLIRDRDTGSVLFLGRVVRLG